MTGKGAAMAQYAADLQPRTMAQQHMLDDGQTQPGAAGVGIAAGVDAVEALGQARQVLVVDAYARVLHAQVSACAVSPPANVHAAAVGGVFDRIEYQIGKRAAQLGFAALEGNSALNL